MYDIVAEIRIQDKYKSKINELKEMFESYDYNTTELNNTLLVSEEINKKFTDKSIWVKGRDFNILGRKMILVNNDGNIHDYLKYCAYCYHEQPFLDGHYTEPHICPFCNSEME